MCSLLILIGSLVSSVYCAALTMESLHSESYLKLRNEMLAQEKSRFLGSRLNLSEKELMVNRALLQAKQEELDAGYRNPATFLPSLHFFQAKERIDKSQVLNFIRGIPKGGSLHTHLLAAVSVDFLMKNVSYRDNLYYGYVNGVLKLKFLRDSDKDNRCVWESVEIKRREQGSEVFDKWLRQHLTLWVENPKKEYPNAATVWPKFKKIFTTTYDLFSYRPVFEDYLQELFQELYDDNIMYTELKGTIMPLYKLDGKTYSKGQFFEIFIKAIEHFKKSHPNFIGAKYIHSVYRGVNSEDLSNSLEELIQLKQKFPNLIAGFDFVGFEEEGYSLTHFSPELLKAREHLNFYFHAGETNWFGHTDLNLADAILLNATRIGHGLAIVKHPRLLELGKERNIPLEVCPLSNQVLMLNEDPRNHPAAQLMAMDYPIVVGNDDPSIWNASGLRYDWYVVFMAMTPKDSGIEVLKQLAINSIMYSSLTDEEKNSFFGKWEKQWDLFCNDKIKEIR